MGWVGVLFVPVIIMKTSVIFMLFILLGGLAYTGGAHGSMHKKIDHISI